MNDVQQRAKGDFADGKTGREATATAQIDDLRRRTEAKHFADADQNECMKPINTATQ